MIRVVALLVLLGSGPPRPTGTEASWSVANAEVTVEARQTGGDGACHLVVIHDADHQVLWQRDGCFGGRSDPKFLSPDGSRLMVFASYPALPGQGKQAWRKAAVGWLFVKGERAGELRAGQLVKDGSKVRAGVRHFSWLQGVDGVPGMPPRYVQDGKAVALEAIDGRHHDLAFDRFKIIAAKAEAKPARGKHRRRH